MVVVGSECAVSRTAACRIQNFAEACFSPELEKMACFAFRASGLDLDVSGGKREELPCTEPEQMVSGSQCLRELVANRKS